MPPDLTPEQKNLVEAVKAKRAELEEAREKERRLLNEIDRLLRDGEDIVREVKLERFGPLVGMTGSNVGKILGPKRAKEA